jgi:hypothetical protein
MNNAMLTITKSTDAVDKAIEFRKFAGIHCVIEINKE